MVRAVALQPRNGRYLQTLGLIYAKAGEFESARLHIEQSARLQPGVAGVAKLAARINNDLGDSDRAVYWYELALASEPYGPRLLAEAADYYETVGESELMNMRLADYEVLQFDVLDPVIGGIPGAALRLARARRDLGDAERASHWYETALVQAPHDPVLLVEATRFYSDSGNRGLMFVRLEREELVDWSVDYDQWELIADLYDVLGDGEYADRIRDPVGAARTFLDLGDAERASHWYETALVQAPHDPVLLVEATRFYSDSGNRGLMLVRLEREELVDWSVDYDQWELIADLYDVLGDGEYADRIRDPVGAARTFLDLGDAERASHWYERALVREPCEVGMDFDYLLHEAVDVYEALGDITGAERTLDRLGSVSCP
jgi:tetratricopeptide (TPR) repeat protein